MDRVPVALVIQFLTENACFSLPVRDDILSYDIDRCIVQGYPAEISVLGKRQKVDDGPVPPILALVIDANWLFGDENRTI